MYMTYNHLIRILINRGIVQRDYTLNPVFYKRLMNDPELTQLVLNLTAFLRVDACLKMRVHVILQGIVSQPTCATCGKDVGMRLSGRYRFTFPRHCCSACTSKDPEVLAKRAGTNLRKYGAKTFLASDDYSKCKSVSALNTSL